MGGMFGGKAPQAQKQQPVGALNVQTSIYGSCIPYVYGKNRVPVNLIHYVNFKAIPHTTKQKTGGKGGGKSATNTTYTYQVAMAASVANGQVNGIGTVWKNKEKHTLSSLGLTLFTGAPGQTPWSYLSSNVPSQARPYADTAYIASPALDLGDSPSLPNLNVEVKGYLPFNAGTIDDAEPSAILTDYLTHVRRGVDGFANYLGNLDSGNASYRKYCTARGLFISPIENNQRNAGQFLKEIADITNSAVVWRSGKLVLIPYGDVAVTGNGSTYTPDLTPLYDLTYDDFMFERNAPPVKHSRKPQAQAYNHIRIEFNDRANDYNPSVVEVKDQADIDDNGLRSKAVQKFSAITTADVARDVAQLLLQRELYVRNVYSFRLGVRHSLLECMDFVTVTDDALGLDRQLVRIVSVVEQDDYIDIEAEEVNVGTANAPKYNTSNPLGYNQDFNVDPGAINDPLIMNAPGLLTETGYEMWMAVSGANPDVWGGCVVWISDDNAEYRRVGEVYGSARHGALSAAMSAGTADYDTTSVARVQLFNGQILSGTQEDCDDFRTLLYVGGEWMSYRDAVLVSGTTYDLDTFRRAAYGSTRAGHGTSSAVAVIDEAIFKLPYDKGNRGKVVYFKFQSFNVFGGGIQDLADVTAIPHTIGASELTAPMNFADVGGNGINLLRDDYVSFTTLPPTGSTSGATGRSIDTSNKIFDGALSTTFSSAGSNWTYIGSLAGDTYLRAGRYIISSWVRSNALSTTPRWVLRNAASGNTYNGTNFTTAPTNTWTRESSAITIAEDGWYALGLDAVDGLAQTILIDGLMIEPQVGTLNQPSTFVRGVARPMVLSAIAAAAAAQDTADGKIETFIQPSMPSGASLGDLWFDSDAGNKMYRHNGTTFVVAQDTAIGQAILDAAGAQATADGKVRTWFTASTSAPTASAVGDLWYQTDTLIFKRWNGSAWTTVGTNKKNKNLLKNPTGMHDFDAWTGWIGAGRQRMVVRKESFGFAFACDGPNNSTATDQGASQTFDAPLNGGPVTLSANMYSFHMGGSNNVIIELRFYNSSDVEIDTGNRPRITSDNSYNATDRRYVTTATSPAGTAKVAVILRASGTFNAGPGAFVRWWDIKVEAAAEVTPYSDDATPKPSPIDVYEEVVTGGFRWRDGLRVGSSGVRLGNQRNNVRSSTSAYGMVRTTTALSATSAGAVTVNAHTVRYGGYSVSYNAVSNAVTGLTVGTTYVIYCIDAALAGGTRTYFAGTNPDAVMNISDDVYVVGQITIPSSGSSSGGGGGGGSNPGDWCVASDSFLPDGTFAGTIERGMMLPCYNNRPDAPNIVHLPVQANVPQDQVECLRLVTESGAAIVASTTTPMTLRNGACVLLPDMLHRDALVYRHDGTFKWEQVVRLEYAGLRNVAKISVRDQCYFAGETMDAFIATHNIQQMKP